MMVIGPWKRGNFNKFKTGQYSGRFIRLGAYGDIGAIPRQVVDNILEGSIGRTGYTHAWRSRPDLAQYVMASTHSAIETQEANRAGFRAFEARAMDTSTPDKYLECPASDRAGKRLACIDCRACHGNANESGCNVTIEAHGRSKIRATKVALTVSAA